MEARIIQTSQQPVLGVDYVSIRLLPFEHEHAAVVGLRRTIANATEVDATHYDRKKMEHDFIRGPISACCELAVAKYLNQYWHAGVWHKTERALYGKLPDVGQRLEVRSFRTQLGPTVRESDVERRRVVWGCKSLDSLGRDIAIFGCVDAQWAWSFFSSARADRAANGAPCEPHLVVPANDLYKPWLGSAAPEWAQNVE